MQENIVDTKPVISVSDVSTIDRVVPVRSSVLRTAATRHEVLTNATKEHLLIYWLTGRREQQQPVRDVTRTHGQSEQCTVGHRSPIGHRARQPDSSY